MSRERELLVATLKEWDSNRGLFEFHKVIEEIRSYFAEPEVSKTTTEQRLEAYKELEKEIGDQANLRSFLEGICFAEKQLKNPQNTLNHKNSESTDALNAMQSHCRGDKC